MLKYVLKRIGLAIITLFIIVFFVFIIFRMLPNFVRMPLGADPVQWIVFLEREGYNKPILEQFWIWIGNIFLRGNFGYSTVYSKDTVAVLATRIPISIKLGIIPYLISTPLGIGLGALAALKKNKAIDHVISIGVVLFVSLPMVVTGVLLQYIFVYGLNIIPEPFVMPDDLAITNPIGSMISWILPIGVLTISSVAGWARVIRSELTEVLTSEYLLLASTKGMTRRQATLRHALRNAIVPYAPSIVGDLIAILSGAMIVEQTFRIIGVGNVYINALGNKDYPMLMLTVLFYTAIGLLAGLIGDLSYGIVDPRIKMGAGKNAS